MSSTSHEHENISCHWCARMLLPRNLFLTEALEKRFGSLCKTVREAAARKGSKWTIVTTSPAPKGTAVLTPDNFWGWVHSVAVEQGAA